MLSAHSQFCDADLTLLLINGDDSCQEALRPALTGHTLLQNTASGSSSLPPLPGPEISIILLSIRDTDVDLQPDIDRLKYHYPGYALIVLAPKITQEQGRQWIKAGASDFISLAQSNSESLQRAFRYVLESHRRQAEIDQLQNLDPLTQLSNRRYFYQQLLHKLPRANSGAVQLGLLTIDLDGFRKLNTTHGHSAGDQVVMQLAQRLERASSQDDLIARLGGDEFAILLECEPGADLNTKIRNRIQAIMVDISIPYQLPDTTAILPCSIGAAGTHNEPLELDELLRRTSLARLMAKQDWHCSYKIYTPELNEQQNIENALEPELAHALRAEQFELFFQPQVNLRTGKIAGAETLIRWIHPQRGLIMPGSFIDLSERNGMIIPMGYWAIHRAGMRLRELHLNGYDHIRIGVNLSFRQFQDGHLAHTIQRIINQNDINGAFLEFELTESALISDEQHVSYCLQELSNLSINFSLDDFGTGYSSFALLQKLPISSLKIDRSFIRNVTEDPKDAEIVRAIINLSHNLDKKVVAEGVETQAQMDFLIEHGCDYAQGYLFSPPVPFKEFTRMLDQESVPCGS